MNLNEILNFAVSTYSRKLYSNIKVLNYLAIDRGLSPEFIDQMKLGYSDKYTLQESIYEEELLSEFCDHHLTTANALDYFNGYITFPVYKDGELYTIYGRAYKDLNVKHRMVRGIDKKVLYNGDSLKDTNYVFIVESPIDCITLIQNGLKSVALLGCKLSYSLASCFRDKICYILFDSDSAGQLGADRVAGQLSRIAKEVRVVRLTSLGDKVDVNSFFITKKNPVAEIRNLVKNSPVFSVSDIQRHTEQQKKLEEAVESNVDIVKVAKKLFSRYRDNKLGGIWVRCPRHNNGQETKSSLWVGGSKNMFNCFGCNTSGGPIKLVAWALEISYKDARTWISNNVEE